MWHNRHLYRMTIGSQLPGQLVKCNTCQQYQVINPATSHRQRYLPHRSSASCCCTSPVWLGDRARNTFDINYRYTGIMSTGTNWVPCLDVIEPANDLARPTDRPKHCEWWRPCLWSVRGVLDSLCNKRVVNRCTAVLYHLALAAPHPVASEFR